MLLSERHQKKLLPAMASEFDFRPEGKTATKVRSQGILWTPAQSDLR